MYVFDPEFIQSVALFITKDIVVNSITISGF